METSMQEKGEGLLELNLGCGMNLRPGCVNVDKFGTPDVLHDLESFPWPWADSSVGRVYLTHVLEHLGATADAFIGVMKELYRVCAPGAWIEIAVPHPRHDNFIGDPTHVRIISAQVMSLFSRQQCEAWVARGFSNTPLALYHGVDFQLCRNEIVLEERYREQLQRGEVSSEWIDEALATCNNIASEIRLTLRVLK